MRGLWDLEQALSPSTLRSAVGVFTWMIVALVAFNLLGALGTLFQGRVFAALVRLLSGAAIPFAVWLAVRLLADLLILQSRTAERLERVLDRLDPPTAPPTRSPDPVRPGL